jgi:hypothetical protein
MRVLVLAVLISCGTDVAPALDAAPAPTGNDPDGGAPIPPGSDGRGPDAPLTVCEEANQHSDLAWIQQTVFTPACARSSCHTSAAQTAGLDLSAGNARASLVDQPSSTQSGWTRVVPGNPDASYLMVAIGAAAGPAPDGGVMPLGAGPLCAEQKAAIGRWITVGAPQ